MHVLCKEQESKPHHSESQAALVITDWQYSLQDKPTVTQFSRDLNLVWRFGISSTALGQPTISWRDIYPGTILKMGLLFETETL
jgi:hypothetical protein